MQLTACFAFALAVFAQASNTTTTSPTASPTARPTTAPPTRAPTAKQTCAAQTSCGACFGVVDESCVWCFVPGPGVNATVSCTPAADAVSCPPLPDIFSGLDLEEHGKDACSLATCIEDLHADEAELNAIENDLKHANECFQAFQQCEQNNTEITCTLNCAELKLVNFTSKCAAIAHHGNVCTQSLHWALSETTNGTKTLTKDITAAAPRCISSSCAANAAELSRFAAISFNASIAPRCREPMSCAWADSFACVGPTPEPAKAGMSTGTIIAIIAGSCLGLALVCYCGAQSCKKKENDYEAF